jgi:hypothetical protein
VLLRVTGDEFRGSRRSWRIAQFTIFNAK